MKDITLAKARCLQNNIERYCRLLATELTDIERDFIHRRIAQERTDLEALLQSKMTTSVEGLEPYIAAKALGGGRNHSEA